MLSIKCRVWVTILDRMSRHFHYIYIAFFKGINTFIYGLQTFKMHSVPSGMTLNSSCKYHSVPFHFFFALIGNEFHHTRTNHLVNFP